jgi:hypothetical protein
MTSKKTVALRALLFLVACPVILIVAGPLTKTAAPLRGQLLVGIVASFFTFLLTFVFVHWDGLQFREVGTGVSVHTVPQLFVGFVIGSAIVLLQMAVVCAGAHTHWVVASHQPLGITLLALIGYFALALREELAFRGYALFRLEGAWGTWCALLFITVIFTLEHTASGWSWSRSLLGPPAGALLFGVAALSTRGIFVPLGIHAAFNFGQWFVGLKETAGVFRPVVDTGFNHQADALGFAGYLAGMFLAALGFWLWRKHHA